MEEVRLVEVLLMEALLKVVKSEKGRKSGKVGESWGVKEGRRLCAEGASH